MHSSDYFIPSRQRFLPLFPPSRLKNFFEYRFQFWRPLQTRKSRPEPFTIRRIFTLYQEAKPHQIFDLSRGNYHRAQLVSDIAAPPDKSLLLEYLYPLCGKHVEPDILRVIVE